MMRCELCQDPFTARAGARFCSSTCRSRAWRLGGVPAPGPVSHECEEATRKALEDAGRLTTPSGQAALVLAREIDNHSRLTAGGLAAVAKQFRDSLGKALEQGPRGRDRVDELTARRMQRLS